MDKLFRSLILISNAIYVLWFFQPYNTEHLYESETLVALSWIGFGSIELVSTVSTYIISPLYIVAAVGLWFYFAAARVLFVVLIATSILLAPFTGLSVQTGIDMLLSQIVIGIDGIVLYMCYFSSVSANFTHNKSSNLTGANDAPSS
jgi:hypothetical protein